MPNLFSKLKYSANILASGYSNLLKVSSSTIGWPVGVNFCGFHCLKFINLFAMCWREDGLKKTSFVFLTGTPLVYPYFVELTLGVNIPKSTVQLLNTSSNCFFKSVDLFNNLPCNSKPLFSSNAKPFRSCSFKIKATWCSKLIEWALNFLDKNFSYSFEVTLVSWIQYSNISFEKDDQSLALLKSPFSNCKRCPQLSRLCLPTEWGKIRPFANNLISSSFISG